jgi:hypothetical protein
MRDYLDELKRLGIDVVNKNEETKKRAPLLALPFCNLS